VALEGAEPIVVPGKPPILVKDAGTVFERRESLHDGFLVQLEPVGYRRSVGYWQTATGPQYGTGVRHAVINSEDFAAGIFIGGMEGVEDEYDTFRELHPRKPAFPIASTGAAARILFDKYSSQHADLLSELTYLSLFRRLLEIY
jgi:SLOG cluster3 family